MKLKTILKNLKRSQNKDGDFVMEVDEKTLKEVVKLVEKLIILEENEKQEVPF